MIHDTVMSKGRGKPVRCTLIVAADTGSLLVRRSGDTTSLRIATGSDAAAIALELLEVAGITDLLNALKSKPATAMKLTDAIRVVAERGGCRG